MARSPRLSHLDSAHRPQMVDVGGKKVTRRTAHATAVVVFPKALAALLTDGDIVTAKGSLFQVAILAGIMGAKKTSELIPLCHPLPLDDCQVKIEAAAAAPDGSVAVTIHCHARTEARTGVEMEALTGASVAALALYDMGKAVTHGIVIREIRLREKTGGKRDFRGVKKTVLVRYFAILREQRGLGEERVETAAATAADLYRELQGRHPFTLAAGRLRVAVNDAFEPWEVRLQDGDAVAFLPPVAGG